MSMNKKIKEQIKNLLMSEGEEALLERSLRNRTMLASIVTDERVPLYDEYCGWYSEDEIARYCIEKKFLAVALIYVFGSYGVDFPLLPIFCYYNVNDLFYGHHYYDTCAYFDALIDMEEHGYHTDILHFKMFGFEVKDLGCSYDTMVKKTNRLPKSLRTEILECIRLNTSHYECENCYLLYNPIAYKLKNKVKQLSKSDPLRMYVKNSIDCFNGLASGNSGLNLETIDYCGQTYYLVIFEWETETVNQGSVDLKYDVFFEAFLLCLYDIILDERGWRE